MLIEFSVGNFTSFNETITLSMVSTTKKELDDHTVEIKISKKSNFSLNRLAAVFGANASGKTNLFYAFRVMRRIVMGAGLSLPKEDGNQERRELPQFKPFAFIDGESKRPTTFEAVFLVDEDVCRYGFSYGQEGFCEEWLHADKAAKHKETLIFKRNGADLEFDPDEETSSELASYKKYITDENLFLTVLTELKVEKYARVMRFFQNVKVAPFSDDLNLKDLSELVRNEDVHLLSCLLRFADTGLYNVSTGEIPDENALPDELPQEATEELQAVFKALKTLKALKELSLRREDMLDFKAYTCKFKHGIYSDTSNEVKEYPLTMDDESRGTLRYISLVSHFLDALKNDKLLIVDEMDRSLHPLLVEGLIRLFIEVKSRAQLLFSSHCPFIFDQKKIRRDELWLVDKNRRGESRLASASDYQARGDGNLAKGYLGGRFGGIPFIQNHLLKKCAEAINSSRAKPKGA